ncbi:MAG: hypothetical protein IT383_12605 [Deltaproteobacteria bacterium]|nr:hypothetical protein [Deltaproteobacteria bacterium]
MLLSALLVLAAAPTDAPPGAPQAPVWRIDAPLVLVAQAPTSGNETRVTPWLGVRVTRMLEAPPEQLVVLGGDLAATLGYGPTEGTQRVNFARMGAALDARALLAVNALHSATTWLRPYGFGATHLGGELGILSAYDDQRYRFLPVWGLSAGLGVELTVHVLSLRVDLGAGTRNGGFALESSFGVGAAF